MRSTKQNRRLEHLRNQRMAEDRKRPICRSFTTLDGRRSRLSLQLVRTLLASTLVLSSASYGREADRLPVSALLDASSLEVSSKPVISSDGRMIAFSVVDGRRHQDELDRIRNHELPARWWTVIGADIWVKDLRSGAQRRVTNGAQDCWRPSWSPQGDRLAFLCSGTDGKPTLWQWLVKSDIVSQVPTKAIIALGDLFWTENGQNVIALIKPDDERAQAFKPANAAANQSRAPTVHVFGYDPSRPAESTPSGQLDLNFFRNDIAVINVSTGNFRLIAVGSRVGLIALSPDKKSIGWIAIEKYAAPGSEQLLGSIQVTEIENGRTRELASHIPIGDLPISFGFAWSLDGSRIAYQSRGPEDVAGQIYVLPRTGGVPIQIADNGLASESPEPAGFGQPLWMDANTLLYARDGVLWRVRVDGASPAPFATLPHHFLRMINDGAGQLWSPDQGKHVVVQTLNASDKRVGYALVDVATGNARQLFEEEKRYGGYARQPPTVSPDGKALAYIAEDASHPPDLWMIDLATNARPVQVSHVAPDLEHRSFGSTKLVRWLGGDGEEISGALLLPSDYRPGVRYPLILRVYGGDDGADSVFKFGMDDTLIYNEQMFATRGYAVLFAGGNLRVGTPMLDIAKNILPGINKLVEMGIVDGNRVGVIGQSYGGDNVLQLIVQSSRFRAAVSSAGRSNLLTAYGLLEDDGSNYNLSWAETGQGGIGGSPWQYRDRYIENSPYFYLDRVSTPLLLIHGGDDRPETADETFSAMRRLGKRVEYARYDGEGHHQLTWSRANQEDYWARVLGWFDRYLSPGASN